MADEKKNGNGKMSSGSGMACDCGSGCGGGYRGGGRHWTFFLLRTLLTILILMLVFWFGVVAARMGAGYYGGGRTYMMRTGYAYPGGMGAAGGAVPMMPVNGTTTVNGGVQGY